MSGIKKEIRRIQLQRRLEKQRHAKTVSTLKQRLNGATAMFHKAIVCQGRNSRSVYQDILEEVMGPCREPEEARLLEVSHIIKINEHLMELMVQQYRKLTDYMVGEINVMEQKRKEIQHRHTAKASILMHEMARLRDCFNTPAPPVERRRSCFPSLPVDRQRSSRGSGRRNSVGSSVPALRRLSAIFSTTNVTMDDDDLSSVSDMSCSVASITSHAAGRSGGTTDTVSSRGEFDSPFPTTEKPELATPEDERFFVIKL